MEIKTPHLVLIKKKNVEEGDSVLDRHLFQYQDIIKIPHSLKDNQ